MSRIPGALPQATTETAPLARDQTISRCRASYSDKRSLRFGLLLVRSPSPVAASPPQLVYSDPHVGDHQRGEEDVQQGEFEKEIPAELHQLIVAEAGKGPSHPDEHEEEESDLREKDSDVH
jgi:hypothetical protein